MTPEQALLILSRCASAAHFAGSIADRDIDAARVAVQTLAALLPKTEDTTKPKES